MTCTDDLLRQAAMQLPESPAVATDRYLCPVIWKRRKPLLTSSAEVVTDAPARYAKQLVSHLGRKVQVEETPDGSVLTFGSGRGVVAAGDGVLVLRAEAEGEQRLAEVQDVLGRHLERFGSKAELVVRWSPASPA